ENLFKADRLSHFIKFSSFPTECGCKKFKNADDMLPIPWSQTIRQIEHDFAPAVLGQRRTVPEDTACVDRQQSRDGLQEGRLTRAIRADQAKNFTAPDTK